MHTTTWARFSFQSWVFFSPHVLYIVMSEFVCICTFESCNWKWTLKCELSPPWISLYIGWPFLYCRDHHSTCSILDDSLRLSIVVPTHPLSIFLYRHMYSDATTGWPVSVVPHKALCLISSPGCFRNSVVRNNVFFWKTIQSVCTACVHLWEWKRSRLNLYQTICIRQFVYNYTRFVVSSSPFMWICSCKVASPVVKFWSLDPENGVVIIVDGIVHTVMLYTQKHFALAFANQ